MPVESRKKIENGNGRRKEEEREENREEKEGKGEKSVRGWLWRKEQRERRKGGGKQRSSLTGGTSGDGRGTRR